MLPTHTHSHLLDFAPPLKHGHFSLGTTSPCELTHRSVTTHNLVQTRQIFPYIVTLGSDLTTLRRAANRVTHSGEKRKPEARAKHSQKFRQPIKVIRFCAECKTLYLPGAHVNRPFHIQPNAFLKHLYFIAKSLKNFDFLPCCLIQTEQLSG